MIFKGGMSDTNSVRVTYFERNVIGHRPRENEHSYPLWHLNMLVAIWHLKKLPMK